jgi:NAD(P)-dependent dehydrogenase (short-subunit alcohol dehydrogenase family)
MTFLSRFDMRGKIAVVTGGNRNLGYASALALAEAGADLALMARDASRLEDAAEEIAAATGRRVVAIPLDQARAEDVDPAFERVHSELGRPDVLVNMAGVEHQGLLIDTEPEDWDRVFGVNLTGMFACVRAFVRGAGDSGGVIVNVASIAAGAGFPGQAAYTASKGGVEAVTRGFAVEFARQGIRVNAIAPGYFEVGMPAEIAASPEQKAKLVKRVPLRRMGRAEELGPIMVFLASDASSFMTGETVYYDGGMKAL